MRVKLPQDLVLSSHGVFCLHQPAGVPFRSCRSRPAVASPGTQLDASRLWLGRPAAELARAKAHSQLESMARSRGFRFEGRRCRDDRVIAMPGGREPLFERGNGACALGDGCSQDLRRRRARLQHGGFGSRRGGDSEPVGCVDLTPLLPGAPLSPCSSWKKPAAASLSRGSRMPDVSE